MSRITARCPANHHHTTTQMTDRNDSQLTVVTAIVLFVDCRAVEYMSGIEEIEAALAQRPFALGRIEGDFPRHLMYIQ